MTDFPPPPPVIDLFHLGPVLTYIADAVYADLQSRGILIANQNSQQAQLSQFRGAIDALSSAVTSGTAQLSANIAALGEGNDAKFDSLIAQLNAIGSAVMAQIDTLNTNLANTLSLLEAMIQAFQGSATLDAQNQMLALLNQIQQEASPERPRTLALDLTDPVTTPQPIPAKQGP